jgi:UDP:flavonoid glycosyltransferase YjiC (YdhE family)
MPSSIHFLLVALGSAGDVHPFVGLGRALKQRGHWVTLVTNPHFEPLVVAAGLDFVPIATEEELLAGMRDPDLWHPYKGFAFVARQLMVPCIRELYRVLDERIGSGPTVIAAPGAALGARVLNEKRGVPLATVYLQPVLIRSLIESPRLPLTWMGPGVPRWFKRFQFWVADKFIDRLLCPELNAFRAELGLPAARGIMRDWWNSPERVIGLFPDWFAPPQADWPANLRLTGFPLWDESDVTAPPPGLEEFFAAGSPPIVFTPGSAMMHAHSFFTEAIEACRILGRRGILLTKYAEQLPAQVPADVAHFPWVPFSLVFPRAAAVVHHGGVGTCGQGLAAGVPQLIMAMSHDQPDNAARLERLGVGLEIRPKHFRGPEVARQLQRLIDQPEVTLRCRSLAARMDAKAALQATCAELESLADLTNGRSGAHAA